MSSASEQVEKLELNCWILRGEESEIKMPELTFQSEAQQIADLAAWCLYEESFLRMLLEAGCNRAEAEVCMTTEAA